MQILKILGQTCALRALEIACVFHEPASTGNVPIFLIIPQHHRLTSFLAINLNFYFWTLSSIVENFSCHLKFVDLQRLVATNENFAEVLLVLVLSMNFLARESCNLMVSFILVDRFQLDKDDHTRF